jgi:hypothetical protein
VNKTHSANACIIKDIVDFVAAKKVNYGLHNKNLYNQMI